MSSHLALIDPDWRAKCQPQRHKTIRERFDEKVERDHETGCLVWLGAHDKDGYGFIRIAGKNIKAHRLALEWKLGRPLLPTEQALHRCDRPACVEESHLFGGNNSENQIDSVIKGRSHAPKLSVADVKSIRGRCSDGQTQVSLAREFRVNVGTIYNIVKRRKWKCVA